MPLLSTKLELHGCSLKTSLKDAAKHEAGHALVLWLLDRYLGGVCLLDHGGITVSVNAWKPPQVPSFHLFHALAGMELGNDVDVIEDLRSHVATPRLLLQGHGLVACRHARQGVQGNAAVRVPHAPGRADALPGAFPPSVKGVGEPPAGGASCHQRRQGIRAIRTMGRGVWLRQAPQVRLRDANAPARIQVDAAEMQVARLGHEAAG